MKVCRFVFLSSIMDKCGCFCDFFSFNNSSISPLNCFSVAMIFAAFFCLYIISPKWRDLQSVCGKCKGRWHRLRSRAHR